MIYAKENSCRSLLIHVLCFQHDAYLANHGNFFLLGSTGPEFALST